MERFKRGNFLILLSTEAAGMGCDISDVLRVVQYKCPESILALVQRLGRAARNPKLRGEGILLVPPPSTDTRFPDNDLANYITTKGCRREVLNSIFGNNPSPNEDCCDNCHRIPEQLQLCCNEIRVDVTPRVRRTAEQKEAAKRAIKDWRSAVFRRDFEPVKPWLRETCVITVVAINKLGEKFGNVTTAKSIMNLSGWTFCFPKHLKELTDMLVQLNEDIDNEGRSNLPPQLQIRDSHVNQAGPVRRVRQTARPTFSFKNMTSLDFATPRNTVLQLQPAQYSTRTTPIFYKYTVWSSNSSIKRHITDWNTWIKLFQQNPIPGLEYINEFKDIYLRDIQFPKIEDDPFRNGYNKYKGAAWVMEHIDEVFDVDSALFAYTVAQEKESVLHSFIIDLKPEDIHSELAYIPEIYRDKLISSINSADQRFLTNINIKCDTWIEHILDHYSSLPSSDPDTGLDAYDQLLSSGWRTMEELYPAHTKDDSNFMKCLYGLLLQLHSLYAANKNLLPDNEKETWYLSNIWYPFFRLICNPASNLQFECAETTSYSSFGRQNTKRSLGTKQVTGRKCDIIFKSTLSGVEIAVVEASNDNRGPNTTKSLMDERKIAKILKDMFDSNCMKAAEPTITRGKASTFGILINGASATLCSLSYIDGRYYRFSKVEPLEIPPTWNISAIIHLQIWLTKLLKKM
ncbi:ATP-dependent DNA helicase sgs1 [Lobosporangium transversale]|uniref:DNA 3'-5' helicase n=1 Tax=Lobosporangium transversale TaxID=64571 RepID=A0A1Y2GD41_9FUNG|nr:hypothetical protein BCR41DRAFT_400046 [Lobosporangium transversale]KAF9904370.1 ATP-dependent DNA helicase sgs1 [Lobosporangium transversale]ORZ06530.1 hypothetical protein BCR41DRAFT_400046 [Lobosporangium transversale]|eukprot:XP_021877573.1 hypothetical protein BCR41DRAFT_400046 [Lobosporangium transversale]